MITWADVVNIAAELSTVPVGRQTAVLAQVALQMNEDVWGSKLDMGSVWLAAHLATCMGRQGTGGAVQSESVGAVSRSYAVSQAASAADLGSTAYGIEYQRILLQLPLARIALAGVSP